MTQVRNDYYVYVLFREDGSPFYVGKGHNSRWLEHECRARAGRKGHRFAIIRKMQAIGLEIPKVKVHEGLTEITAHDYEIALIKAIGRCPAGPLVNLTAGGEGRSDPAPEIRAKMSAALRGRKHTPEAIAKTAAAHRGRKRSPETCAKIGAASCGRIHVVSSETRAKMAAAQRGKTLSPETRAKISAAKCGKKQPPEAVAKTAAKNRGRKMPPEAIARTAAVHRGRKRSPETCAKISAVRRAYYERRRQETIGSAA